MSAADKEIQVLKKQKRLFSFLLPKTPPHIPSEDERQMYPEKSANFISKLLLWWINPVLKVGYMRTLQPNDLYTLTDELKVSNMHATFKTKVAIWKQKRQGKKKQNLTYLYATVDTFRVEYFMAIAQVVVANLLMAFNPLVVRKLISFVEERTVDGSIYVGKGVGLAIGTAFMTLFSGILQNHAFHSSMMVGSKTRAVLIKALTEKSFKLNEVSNHNYPSSKIFSLMGADISRIDMAFGFAVNLVAFPATFITSLVILIVNIGAPALVGVAILIIFLVLLGLSTKIMASNRKYANKHTDTRVSYVQEMLNNLRMIKYYCWEEPCENRIKTIRQLELKYVARVQYIRNLIMAIALSLSNILSMISFLVLYAIESVENVAGIFSSLSLFALLASQVVFLPVVSATVADSIVSYGRIADYLDSEELEVDNLEEVFKPYLTADEERAKDAIEIEDGKFEWKAFDDSDEEHSSSDTLHHVVSSNKEKTSESDRSISETKHFTGLHGINLKIAKGEFIVITGPIGSGKSTLLAAIAGVLGPSSGSVKRNGTVLFCDVPWIQNATVRENILFGSEYEPVRYKETIAACCLESDLKDFTGGDMTEIGERGITLSGGQKARVNLARATYANRDIILMDDVLSAVDSKVGKRIIDSCFNDLIGDKTRVLATHQLSLVGSADRIIFINNDGTIDVGGMAELSSKNKAFAQLMSFNQVDEIEEDQIKDEKEAIELKEQEEQQDVLLETRSTNKSDGIEIKDMLEEKEEREDAVKVRIMRDEGRGQDSIELDTYKNFIKFGSKGLGMYGWIMFYLTTTILAVFCQLFSNVWLSYWVDYQFPNYEDGFYIGLYIMFSFLTVAFVITELLSLVTLNNNAAFKFYQMATHRVLHSPMSFIDTTPLGRILNRFSRDTEILDNEMSNQLRLLSYMFSMTVGILILCVVYLPWFAISLPFFIFILLSITGFYQAGTREIKRLDSVQRSYVYSTAGEIFSGRHTIKIYNVKDMFLNHLDFTIDKMNEAYYLTITSQRWLAIQTALVSFGFSLLISFLCVFRVFNIGAASVGLVMSYVLQLSQQLTVLLRSTTQLENEMNSVERLNEYATALEGEAPYVITENTPPTEWPQNGSIEFKDVALKYRPELPNVLNGLTFSIKSQEKIGICGRTGAGKSLIMTALFRIVELSEGGIFIDDIDISKLGLRDLRSKLSIIPQDPVLFKGTIRSNLDPFEQNDSESMISAMHKVGLIEDVSPEAVAASKFALDMNVEDEGSNYSLGEKQLISFARSLVRESKIIILDEATSLVDYETDQRIQDTIASVFKDCTILCIAHRLKTILDYDRIMVLDRGQVIEFDTPWNLYSKRDSVFRDMCNKTQISSASFKLKV